MEQATLAAGCFWCTEAIFKRLKGVKSVISGYSGGKRDNPNYQQVSTGTTGHTEAIQISFDPQIISYQALLDIFWHTHNPTTINQQGADIGTQYRSVIFYHNNKQKQQALESKKTIQKEFKKPIVTEIVPFENFYKAEANHQEYYDKNPNYPYCQLVIAPKIQKLLKDYAAELK